MQISVYRTDTDYALFLVRQEKGQKKPRKGALRANRAPFTIRRRIANQHSKMFRFLNAFIMQDCEFIPQSPLKIGTFSVGGGYSGGSGVRGEGAIGSERLAPDDFFGYFLVRIQESNIYHHRDKLQFEIQK